MAFWIVMIGGLLAWTAWVIYIDLRNLYARWQGDGAGRGACRPGSDRIGLGRTRRRRRK